MIAVVYDDRTAIMVRQRRWWWTACDPYEPLATEETPTYYRSRTREGAIAKAARARAERVPWQGWETVSLPARHGKPAA